MTMVIFTIVERRYNEELWEARCESCAATSRFWRRPWTGSQFVAMKHQRECPIYKDVEEFLDERRTVSGVPEVRDLSES